ncbi:hypothetical protein IFR05_001826 [Cadophora sp. M221]|nr:hypothetical protein IFR05_001826 [Cadophora sp. M221]
MSSSLSDSISQVIKLDFAVDNCMVYISTQFIGATELFPALATQGAVHLREMALAGKPYHRHLTMAQALRRRLHQVRQEPEKQCGRNIGDGGFED